MDKPKLAGTGGGAPSAVTFFLTGAERARVLAALRRIDHDRARALMRALGVSGERRKSE